MENTDATDKCKTFLISIATASREILDIFDTLTENTQSLVLEDIEDIDLQMRGIVRELTGEEKEKD